MLEIFFISLVLSHIKRSSSNNLYLQHVKALKSDKNLR